MSARNVSDPAAGNSCELPQIQENSSFYFLVGENK
jgi:hypothetical protein